MKAQESISFMIVIGMVIVIFIALASLISSNFELSVKTKSFLQMRHVNNVLANAIYRVYLGGEGSTASVYLEELSENYTIYVRPLAVVIVHDQGSNTFPTYAPLVFNTSVTNGEVLIKNEGGIINVSQVT